MNGSHPAQHIKQECPGDYKVLSEVSAHRRTTEGMELRASGSLHPEIDLMNNSFTNSLSSYLFNNEHSSSLGSLSFGSPQHSARLQSSNLKKRCISVMPSSAEGIDITAIIRTSQTSLVTCVNGLRTNSAGISSHPLEVSHHSAQKSSRPQSCSQPGNPCSLPSPSACLVPISTDCDRGDCDPLQMQQIEENASLNLMMNGTSIPQQDASHSSQKVSFLKQEPVDDYSSNTDLFRHRQGLPPPPYHLHQQLTQTQGTLPHLHVSMSPKSLQPSEGDEQEVSNGTQVCRWIDCNATYDQQDGLVRHLEKTHIDQRKGEDFTCFWAGCVRRYKPFNARYKLLIHMRVHSGEKPNKCMDTCVFCVERAKISSVDIRAQAGAQALKLGEQEGSWSQGYGPSRNICTAIFSSTAQAHDPESVDPGSGTLCHGFYFICCLDVPLVVTSRECAESQNRRETTGKRTVRPKFISDINLGVKSWVVTAAAAAAALGYARRFSCMPGCF
ncbi:Zinc finger protein GLIS3 [Chelonia mydas]|uniref:Zinc finger protein GLIS3 n=1 Tax=Chelonia mydas TaxID=8469 RepID=M7B6I8_CHEMY|nr:Zinc finger protein GLIS3 [Chelonia mydas]